MESMNYLQSVAFLPTVIDDNVETDFAVRTTCNMNSNIDNVFGSLYLQCFKFEEKPWFCYFSSKIDDMSALAAAGRQDRCGNLNLNIGS